MIRTIAFFLIACAAVGQPSAQNPVNCSGPLSEAQLTDLIKGEVPPKRLQLFVTQCGLEFTLTGAEEERLRKAGASTALLAVVREKLELQAETALWESVKDSQEIASFESYLQRYSRGQFAVQANRAIQRLKSLKISRAIEAGDKAISAGDWDAATKAAATLRGLDPQDAYPARLESRITAGREAERRVEAAFWKSVQDSAEITSFEDYLRRYPKGQFVAAANQATRSLKIRRAIQAGGEAISAGDWDAATAAAATLRELDPQNAYPALLESKIAAGREEAQREEAAKRFQQTQEIAAHPPRVNSNDGLTYVWIPPGSFMMGCSPGDSACDADEKPARSVRVPRGFWMGQTEVTQDAYRRVTGQDPSNSKGNRRPVESVNWSESQGYCQAVGMRLPTEEEWEYAARAGDTSPRYWNLDAVAWYIGNSGGQTHEVGQLHPNAWGLYDTLGNVWEWTASDHDANTKVLRGGSWFSVRRDVRVSNRNWFVPGGRYDSVGVRCVGESNGQFEVAAEHTPREAAAQNIQQKQKTAVHAPKVNPKDGLTYVWIPPGRFMMGCSPGDSECSLDEKPTHPVSIPRGFWMGQTEVTQKAYRRVTGQDPSYFKGARRPVEEVNWDEAQAYCQAVGMRLPTEEEWEYAARAGDTSPRYGSLDAVAWYSKNSVYQTHEVRQKRPNAWGLYDMLGNVWEWTASDYGASKEVLRGGYWGNDPALVRVSDRAIDGPSRRSAGIGVRCVGE